MKNKLLISFLVGFTLILILAFYFLVDFNPDISQIKPEVQVDNQFNNRTIYLDQCSDCDPFDEVRLSYRISESNKDGSDKEGSEISVTTTGPANGSLTTSSSDKIIEESEEGVSDESNLIRIRMIITNQTDTPLIPFSKNIDIHYSCKYSVSKDHKRKSKILTLSTYGTVYVQGQLKLNKLSYLGKTLQDKIKKIVITECKKEINQKILKTKYHKLK